MIKIYSKEDILRCTVDDASGQQEKGLQSDNVLTLSFTLYEYVQLDVNDYVDFCGERFWLMERYKPKQKSTVEWVYDLELYGVESLIKRFLAVNYTDGDNNPVFTLTAPAIEHAKLIVKSINVAMGENMFVVGEVKATENLVIDYNGTYCNEALELLGKAAGTEYWFENGTTLNVSRAEYGGELKLGYLNGLISLERETANNVKFYTRLFPMGSTRNIDPAKYGHSRLQLPGGQTYVDKDVDKYGVIHHFEEAAFAGIYPRRVGTVSEVRSEEKTGQDGKPFTIYYFKDSELNFNPNDYEIAGYVKRVSFQEGSELAGQGTGEDHYFEVNYNSGTKEFEMITIFPYEGMQLPGGLLIPKVGDKYILSHLRMPDEYYPLAERELLAAVEKYNEENFVDNSVYKGDTDHVWIEQNNVELFVGRRVRLESDKYFMPEGYRRSRITKITRKVALPSQVSVEISDAISVGKIASMEGNITEVKQYVMQATGGGIDIIGSGDEKKPGEHNVFSAKRSLSEFVSKKVDDVVSGVITFLNGIKIGSRYYIDKRGDALLNSIKAARGNITDLVVETLTVTGVAKFFKLVVDEVKSTSGAYISSPANGFEVVKVEPSIHPTKVVSPENVDAQYYRVYFLAEDGKKKIRNMWEVGDQALHFDFNETHEGETGNAGNSLWWACVVDKSSEPVEVDVAGKAMKCHYITVSHEHGADGSAKVNSHGWDAFNITQGAPMWKGNAIPREGDAVAMLGHRFTSEADKKDKARQSAVYESSYASLDPELTAPLKAYYEGIDDFNLASHRGTYNSTGKSEFVGNLRVTDGRSIDKYIDDKTKDAGGVSTRYWLHVEPTVLVNDGGVMSARTVVITAFKKTGGSPQERVPNGLSHIRVVDDGGATVLDVERSVASFEPLTGKKSYTVHLQAEGVTAESVTIPVLASGGKNGVDGKNGVSYKLVPTEEKAVVSGSDIDTATVDIALRYRVLKTVGDTSDYVDPADEHLSILTDYTLEQGKSGNETAFTGNTRYVNMSGRTQIAVFLKNSNGVLLDMRVVDVVFKPSVVFEVNQALGTVTSDIRTVNGKYSKLQQTVNTLGSEVANKVSKTEFKQTAEEISLKVSRDASARNMLTGGWLDIDDYRYGMLAGAKKQLRVRLEKGKTYTLTACVRKCADDAVHHVRCHIYTAAWDDIAGMDFTETTDTVKSVTFKAGRSEDYYIDFYPQADDDSDASAEDRIHHIMWVTLTEGTIGKTEWEESEADEIATGMDFKHRSITAAADNFSVKNNAGEVTFRIDKDGNLVSTGDASFAGNISATSGHIGGVKIAAQPSVVEITAGYQAYVSQDSLAYYSSNSGRTSYVLPVNKYIRAMAAPNPGRGMTHVEGSGYSKDLAMYTAYVRSVSDANYIEKGVGFATNARVVGSWFETMKGARGLHVYAFGKVNAGGDISMNFSQLGTIRAQRLGTGEYRVTYGSAVSLDMNTVILQAVFEDGNHTKATLERCDDSGFTVRTSNDSSADDSAFQFMVVGMGMS